MTLKLTIQIKPNATANIACYSIYQALLEHIKNNEQAVIAATTSDALHDFRVAIRKTRTGLSQFKGIMSDEANRHYTDFFAWLGSISSSSRDLDSYLDYFSTYQAELVSPDTDLQPLYNFLLNKKQQAHSELVTALQSRYYLDNLLAWAQYLQQPPSIQTDFSIKSLANERLQKNYKKVLRLGKAIRQESSASVLHSLRKDCKKLRYLIEFFQGFYGTQQIKPLLIRLKALQQVLGDFQDCEVQEQQLEQYRRELLASDTPANILFALSALIDNLNERKQQARQTFDVVFKEFKKLKKIDF
jgi:CHAD domain-containing protein